MCRKGLHITIHYTITPSVFSIHIYLAYIINQIRTRGPGPVMYELSLIFSIYAKRENNIFEHKNGYLVVKKNNKLKSFFVWTFFFSFHFTEFIANFLFGNLNNLSEKWIEMISVCYVIWIIIRFVEWILCCMIWAGGNFLFQPLLFIMKSDGITWKMNFL